MEKKKYLEVLYFLLAIIFFSLVILSLPPDDPTLPIAIILFIVVISYSIAKIFNLFTYKYPQKRLYEPLWIIAYWDMFGAFSLQGLVAQTRKRIYRDFYRIRKIVKLKEKRYSIKDISKKLRITEKEVRNYLKQSKKYKKSQIESFPKMNPDTSIVVYGILVIIILTLFLFALETIIHQ